MFGRANGYFHSSRIKAGDIRNFDYTGSAQSIELPAGKYKLEV